MFRTIIWATDGSEQAKEALPFAKALAEDDGRLVVVHSNEIFVGRGGGYPVLADETTLEEEIRHQVDELRSEGFDASFEFVTGSSTQAAHMIADVASKVDADLIVPCASNRQHAAAGQSSARR